MVNTIINKLLKNMSESNRFLEQLYKREDARVAEDSQGNLLHRRYAKQITVDYFLNQANVQKQIEYYKSVLPESKNSKILDIGVGEGWFAAICSHLGYEHIELADYGCTSKFLDICNEKNGNLYSVDVDDYSNLFNDPKWNFYKVRDDNFKYLEEKLPKEVDVIYLDSLHEANHVEKVFYYYFKKLKLNGIFYIDDTSWLPYLKNEKRNNFYCEINNKETFELLLSIYSENTDNFDLSFSFISSGLAIIKKKTNNELVYFKKVSGRDFSLKNILRKLWRKIKKD